MKSPLKLRLLRALLLDFARLEPDMKGLDRDFVTIKARFEHEGIGFLSVALPSLCDAVDYGISKGRFACPTGFKHCQSGALPRLFSGLLCRVFDPRTGSLKDSPCPRAVKCLREALRIFKKLALESKRDDVLHRNAVRTFWESDSLCKGSFDPLRAGLLSRVAGYILASPSLNRPGELVPRHGPGAVYEKLAANQKWSAIYQNVRNADFDVTKYGFDVFGCPEQATEAINQLEYPHSIRGYPGVLQSDVSHRLSCGSRARLVSVPKNSVSRRTITVEPVLKMFIQQGLNQVLRDNIEKCPILSKCLALEDQSINQKLALIGSITGEWTTLDLSSASDLLSLDMVKLVFGRHQEFLDLMIECRTQEVEFEDGFRPLKKFAGMGNALTFPVQSIAFAVIAMSSILFTDGFSRPRYWDVKRAARRVRVYGDDIIVPTEYACQVVDWIESFGLKVNRKKSFMEGNFRESCGLDAYMGVDVTPVYVKDDPDESSKDPSTIAGLVAASNLLWDRCLYGASQVLKDVVEEAFGRQLPLVSRECGGLGWITRDGASDVQRWNKKLHYLEIKVPVLKPTKVGDRLGGYPALLKFFLTPLIERDKEHLRMSVKRFDNRIAWKWMPAQAGTKYVDRVSQLLALNVV
jgi:hypothetical protein